MTEIEQLRLENAALKEDLETTTSLLKKLTGRLGVRFLKPGEIAPDGSVVGEKREGSDDG